MKRTCVQCGKEFELSNSEIGFYKKRKLSLPKRCKECRELNKKASGKPQQTAKETGKSGLKSGTEAEKAQSQAAARALETGTGASAGTCNCTKKKGKAGIKRTLAAAAVLAVAAIYSAVTGNLPIGSDKTENAGGPGQSTSQENDIDYTFRTEELFESHYEKHGIEMGFDSAEEYLAAANDVIDSPDVLHKTEAEDGDGIYFLEDTNEFVVLSTDGYIRTYYIADGGMDYYERQ